MNECTCNRSRNRLVLSIERLRNAIYCYMLCANGNTKKIWEKDDLHEPDETWINLYFMAYLFEFLCKIHWALLGLCLQINPLQLWHVCDGDTTRQQLVLVAFCKTQRL